MQKPKKRTQISFDIPKELKDRMNVHQKEYGVPMAVMVRRGIELYLQNMNVRNEKPESPRT